MKVYRIEREKYLKTTLSGTGASRTNGYRWNSLHTKLVYTAESRALATLEVSVHLDFNEDLPMDRYYVEIDIPENIIVLEVDIDYLPEEWNAMPPTLVTQTIGDDFVIGNEASVLKVPSSAVFREFNYLINPNHPDIKKIKVLSTSPMRFDPRFKSR